MLNEWVTNILTPQAQQKAQIREFRLMAQLLAQQFHINHGDNLVRLLGNGDQRNNLEAIIYWLAEEREHIEEMKALQLDPLDHLRNELNKKLINAEHGF